MIYELARLPVRADRADAFRQAFAKVEHLLTRAEGYRGHVLAQGVESPRVFTLIVQWRSLEDHAPRFEASQDHATFMGGLQDLLEGEPEVFHADGPALAQRQV
jgi:heme-degrading monooxygenase HmoA